MEVEKVQQRADGAAEALRAVVREERAINTGLRRELAAAQLQVNATAKADRAPMHVLEPSNDYIRRFIEKILQQHRRGREFKLMLHVFRRWLFLSDVRLAAQQQKADQERKLREDAQTRELSALRRELRAVVTASVASDMHRAETEAL